ncbi:MAG: hypothetical protein QOA17_10775 [Nitrososphaeraceae archaeon]|nr:hypothetical protein [Nitrososphaeraceae archaeon]
MADYLNILDPIEFDKSIDSFQYSEYPPQSQSNINNPGGIIQIDVNASDTYLLPSKSFIHIKGQLVRADNTPFDANTEIALVNNAMMFLFENISYQIGATVVESISSPGQITTLLGLASYPDDYNTCAGLMSCWSKDTTTNASSRKFNRSPAVAANAVINAGDFTPSENPNYNQGFAARRALVMGADPRGHFSFLIPFDHIFGFGYYEKVIYNIKHSLKFTRKSTDHLAIHSADGVPNGKIILSSIAWRVPVVKPELSKLVELRELIESKLTIPVGFQARTTDSTVVTQTREFTWRTNVTSGVEKPRWIFVAFQTNRNETQQQNPAVFDNVNLATASAKLNNEDYPAENIVVNFATNDYTVPFQMFDNYKKEFFGYNSLVGGTQVNFATYKSLYPIIVFDVTRQNEKLSNGVIDMQLKFKFHDAIPANTMAYVAIISDRVFYLNSDGKNLVMVSS